MIFIKINQSPVTNLYFITLVEPSKPEIAEEDGKVSPEDEENTVCDPIAGIVEKYEGNTITINLYLIAHRNGEIPLYCVSAFRGKSFQYLCMFRAESKEDAVSVETDSPQETDKKETTDRKAEEADDCVTFILLNNSGNGIAHCIFFFFRRNFSILLFTVE